MNELEGEAEKARALRLQMCEQFLDQRHQCRQTAGPCR